MTRQEIQSAMRELMMRESMALKDVAQAARSMIPVLRDHQMAATADALAEKLFILDAVDGERLKFFENNAHEVLDVLLGGLSK